MAVVGSAMTMRAVWLVCCGLLLAEALPLPWRSKLGMRDSQACGDRLADIMSLVCSGRGYNVAFIPERSNGRRFRRGIVDECCYKSCPRVLLEQYCQTDSTEDRAAVPIRKRSDGMASSEFQQPETTSKLSNTEPEAVKPIAEEKQQETTGTSTSVTKEGDGNYKLLNLLAPPQKQNTKSLNTKLTPNDTTEELYRRDNHNPPLRHRSHHHSSGSRQLHSRKATSKTKRAKDVSAESSQTFQIGMVKPYFARQAHGNGNYVHRT